MENTKIKIAWILKKKNDKDEKKTNDKWML